MRPGISSWAHFQLNLSDVVSSVREFIALNFPGTIPDFFEEIRMISKWVGTNLRNNSLTGVTMKEDKMKRITTALAAALVSSAPALAANAPVGNVDVDFDLQSVESPAAAKFWGHLETDLEAAIIAKVVDRTAETGTEVEIDIDEFSLSNSFQAALGADSVLSGSIEIVNEEDPTVNTYYTLMVTMAQAGKTVFGEDGMQILTIPEEEAYDIIIDAFARNVVGKLD